MDMEKPPKFIKKFTKEEAKKLPPTTEVLEEKEEASQNIERGSLLESENSYKKLLEAIDGAKKFKENKEDIRKYFGENYKEIQQYYDLLSPDLRSKFTMTMMGVDEDGNEDDLMGELITYIKVHDDLFDIFFENSKTNSKLKDNMPDMSEINSAKELKEYIIDETKDVSDASSYLMLVRNSDLFNVDKDNLYKKIFKPKENPIALGELLEIYDNVFSYPELFDVPEEYKNTKILKKHIESDIKTADLKEVIPNLKNLIEKDVLSEADLYTYVEKKVSTLDRGHEFDEILKAKSLSSNENITEMIENKFLDFIEAEKTHSNTLRHLFTEVIQGEREFINKDRLIRLYAEKGKTSFDDFTSLFIEKSSPIDNSYAQLFFENIDCRIGNMGYKVSDLSARIDDALSLGKLEEADFKEIITNISKVDNIVLKTALRQKFKDNEILAQEIYRENDEEFFESILKEKSEIPSDELTALLSVLEKKEEKGFFIELLLEKNRFKEIINIISNTWYVHEGFFENKGDYLKEAIIQNIDELDDNILKNVIGGFFSETGVSFNDKEKLQIAERIADSENTDSIYSLLENRDFSSQFTDDKIEEIIDKFIDKYSEGEGAMPQNKHVFDLFLTSLSEYKELFGDNGSDRRRKLGISVLNNARGVSELYELAGNINLLGITIDSKEFKLKLDGEIDRSSGRYLYKILQNLDDGKGVPLSSKQERKIFEKSFKDEFSDYGLVILYEYDKELFNEQVNNKISTFYDWDHIPDDFWTLVKFEKDHSTKISDHIEKYLSSLTPDKISKSDIEQLLSNMKHLDDEVLENFKKELMNKLSPENGELAFKLSPVALRFLNGGEMDEATISKFYKSYSSIENTHRKMISTGVFVSNILKLDNYFEVLSAIDKKSDPNLEANINKLKDFINIWSVGNKGETIVGLLLTKESQHTVEIGDLIFRVVSSLNKFEDVLNQYNIDGIPEGLRASIGMEYEITGTVADAYEEVSGNLLENDLNFLADGVAIGKGRDARFELATKPATHPYMLFIETKLLEELDFIDFNFNQEKYEKNVGGGIHVTIGGEGGVKITQGTNFLQNVLFATNWAGFNAGKNIEYVTRGRSSPIRQRDASATYKVFDEKTEAVEMRSLSIDRREPFERVIMSSFNGAIANQAYEKYISKGTPLINVAKELTPFNYTKETLLGKLRELTFLEKPDIGEKESAILYEWLKLVSKTYETINDHNENFYMNETQGYLGKDEIWVDTSDFRGEKNKNRFGDIMKETLGEKADVRQVIMDKTNIKMENMFSSISPEVANALIFTNNLFLKPSKETGGDQPNVIASLETTKIDNNLEEASSTSLRSSILDTGGYRRKGYYTVQGGSSKMLVHAIQSHLINFNENMLAVISAN